MKLPQFRGFFIYFYQILCYNISMKRKIKIIDNITGKVIEEEVQIPNSLHFEIQKKTKMGIFRDRTKYTRKRKHKGGDIDD